MILYTSDINETAKRGRASGLAMDRAMDRAIERSMTQAVDSSDEGGAVYQPINMKRGAIIYGCISVFCLIVFHIYDRFSHNVRSPFMTFLFAWPLLLGFLPALWILLVRSLPRPNRFTLNVYNSGVAALTVSSMMRGVFEIAGTASPLQTGLMVAGTVMWMVGAGSYIVTLARR